MAYHSPLFVTLVSLVIGALAIHLGARFVVSRSNFTDALIVAAAGALVYGLLGFLQGIPLLGPLVLLLIWIGLINWRYPGDWVNAAAIGLIAWLAAIVLLYVLATVGLFEFGAMGVPGV